jgi:hypothetical protein
MNQPTTTKTTTSTTNVDSQESTPKAFLVFVDMKMVEGRELFQSKNYEASIHAYTEAIKIISSAETTPAPVDDDKNALALSNRAAGLLLVSASDAAVSGCNTALMLVRPLPSNGRSVATAASCCRSSCTRGWVMPTCNLADTRTRPERSTMPDRRPKSRWD